MHDDYGDEFAGGMGLMEETGMDDIQAKLEMEV